MTPPPPSPKQRKLTLHTNHLTPNGLKVSIYLEELRASKETSFDYNIERVDLSKGAQKEPRFIKLNPNGRIPVLIDHSADNFPIFESAAILLYLEQNCDTKKAFSFDAQKEPKEYSSMIQWIFFAEVPFAKTRYHEETKRLYGVLELGLNNRDFLVGPGRGRYTIADMNAFPWVSLHTRAGIESLDAWPNLKDWFDRMSNQPGVKAANKSVAL
ncbi:hypothetical protein DXG01_010599 [Tephrocybe rancida]|nr:hypothetical protein DXG01_010599 [Tephrocybe rancida]